MDDVRDSLNSRPTLRLEKRTPKKGNLSGIDIEAESDSRASFVSLEGSNSQTFCPFFHLAQWIEQKTTNRISLCFLLLSGISSGDFTAKVTEDGNVLEINEFGLKR